MDSGSRDDPESDEALFQSRCLTTMSHQGRMARLLVGLLLSVLGLLWVVPYTGWAHSLILFGPAAVLVVFAGLERRTRRIVLLWSLPTLLGLGLGTLSIVHVALRFPSALPSILGFTLATTLFAAIAGSPPPSR